MYLETILILTRSKGQVRSIDVAEYMSYSKPSVSRAMGLLKTGGYITMDNDGYITLTDSGYATASKILERHTLLSDALVRLGVDAQVAAEDACRIEHVISDQSFAHIKQHIHRLAGTPAGENRQDPPDPKNSKDSKDSKDP
jgi:Mn-dependent DtxR family transcriptional regulator